VKEKSFNKGDKKDGDRKVVLIQPLHNIIKEIQRLRKETPKGTIMNLLYKEMGNSIYGNVVKGMSNKKNFDTLTVFVELLAPIYIIRF